MNEVEFILYVADQKASCTFYSKLLNLKPSLDVSGMTEFQVAPFCKLGIMPETGIAKLLGDKIANPALGKGISRCELYLKVYNAQSYIDRGVEFGGMLISPIQPRNWGDKVGYISDLDGHIIAFAELHTHEK